MVKKNLTFRSKNLGENVQLMLTFAHPGDGLFVDKFPLAWKVTTLAGKGASVMKASWEDNYAFSATQLGHGSLIVAGNYIPIEPGQTTTLTEDSSVSPPVYLFSDPIPDPGSSKIMRCVNRSSAPANIGLGFISDMDTDEENIHTAFIFSNVGHDMSVSADFIPILSAYVACNYKENEVLRSEISSKQPIWQGNLLELGNDVTLVIKKGSAGEYQANLVNSNFADEDDDDNEDTDANGEAVPQEIAMWKGVDAELWGRKRVFDATLAFENADLINDTLKTIASHLLAFGYGVTFTTKPKNTEVHVRLTLQPGTSCSDAEKALSSWLFPGRAAIKERGGATEVYVANAFAHWREVSPASPEWTYNGLDGLDGEKGASV